MYACVNIHIFGPQLQLIGTHGIIYTYIFVYLCMHVCIYTCIRASMVHREIQHVRKSTKKNTKTIGNPFKNRRRLKLRQSIMQRLDSDSRQQQSCLQHTHTHAQITPWM